MNANKICVHPNYFVAISKIVMLRINTSLIFLVLTICAHGVGAQKASDFGKCPVEYGFRGSYNFTKDSKSRVDVRKLQEISPSVLGRIQEQLQTRVGGQFLKQLKFDHGNAQDFDDASPLNARDEARIDGYDLVFKFSDTNKGLKAFYFKVVADTKGNLIAKPALPDIASHPLKGNFISCKQALAIARKNGFPPERSSIYFMYDWDSRSFVWDIHDSKAVKPDETTGLLSLTKIGQGTYRKIYVNANSGDVIKIFKDTIVF